ncbi:MAG: hypothetical protein K0B02_04205 [DPANN group archaeon]|nr:hypothetical protein [DPANN group archaeon]
MVNLDWLINSKDFKDTCYSELGRTSFFHRYADSGFRTKWCGLWSPPNKFLEYYAYKINNTWLDIKNSTKFIQKPTYSEHEYKITNLNIKETVFIPENSSAMISIITIENTAKTKTDIEINPEIAINIRTKYENYHEREYSNKFIDIRRAILISGKNKTDNIIFGTGQPSKTIEINFKESEKYKEHYQNNEKERCYIPGSLIIKTTLEAKETIKIPIIFATSNISAQDAQNTYDYILQNLENVINNKTDSINNIIKTSTIKTDSDLDKKFTWAALNTHNLVHNSTIGSGIFAGMPWFQEFWGRDTFWSLLGLIDMGEFKTAKECMKTLLKYQKERIPNLVDTKGNTSYIGADTDPLFLIALDYYVKHSGDKKILTEFKKNIKTSLKSLKLDSDFVIHESNETWMDTLKRTGTAIDIQALWIHALESNNKELSDDLKDMLIKFFWDKDSKYFLDTFGKDKDKSLTINAAVPLMFGQVPEEEALLALDKINTEFKTAYGARTRSKYDPTYNPEGYHTGSVWGLTTGWVACANFEYSLKDDGLKYLNTMANHMKQNQIGTIGECYNAETGQLTGAHIQAWSSALFVHAIDNYLFGIRPNLSTSTIEIIPAIPSEWKYASRKNKIIGNYHLETEIKLKDAMIEIGFNFEKKPNLKIKLNIKNFNIITKEITINNKKTKIKDNIIEFKTQKSNLIQITF